MTEQIKYTLWKLLIVAAVLAGYSGATVLADAGRAEIYEVGAVDAGGLSNSDKPVNRCPSKTVWIRTSCKPVIIVKPTNANGGAQNSTENRKAAVLE